MQRQRLARRPRSLKASKGYVITLTPVGKEMTCAETKITVHSGPTVTLTTNNAATSETMRYNVAVLKSRGDVQTVGRARALVADTDCIAPRTVSTITARTPRLAPGETAEVTFTATARTSATSSR